MATPAPAPLDLGNVQGDILLGGIPKKTETYFFFQIDKDRVHEFRTQLAQLVPLIKTTAQISHDRERISQNKKDAAGEGVTPPLLKLSGVNIAFTHKGLVQMGINDDIGDGTFTTGMLADASSLGDKGTTSASGTFDPNWDPEFKQDIHGLILIAGNSHATVNETLKRVERIFSVKAQNATIHEVTRKIGDVRPKKESGHEHFGFLDGISHPAVQGVDTTPNRGQETVRQGIILLGRDGDGVAQTRPSWALDGSFLAFRNLPQLVPEFNAFLDKKPVPGLNAEQLGARLVGRWKSGAPVDVTPTVDDPDLGADPTRNNDFSYNGVFPNDQQTQDRCPFAAHVRKTNPRADLAKFGGTEIRRIIRSGIQFGPEVSAAEAAAGKTSQDRGLLFVCYQSNIGQGFKFIQQSWANRSDFPPSKPVMPGLDPIIGQTNDPTLLKITGANPSNQGMDLTLPTEWVVPKGGEYFFSPSIPALKGTFALTSSSVNGTSAELR